MSVIKNKNHYLNTLLHHLLFFLSNFMTSPFVLPDKNRAINSQNTAFAQGRKFKNLQRVKIWTKKEQPCLK